MPSAPDPLSPASAGASPTRPLGSPPEEGEPRVTLIGKPGCHLCDNARAVIAAVTAELGESFTEVSILDHQDLRERYAEEIPVTLVDGRQHDYWRVDADRLRAALRRPN
ncbi:glutaredoxin-like protein DUF836 [Knoellia remsis]|uniref:Glutaredoxin-like protein DUF836 n=1 Tax=Knoellia remsis TaxID=407159 RepID=A0A2T0UN15_9MICO|nr:glutaredoxin family protein [Knoellia remsis]PRY59323.1 glutaredoxin-like protein DUF836 [Knoellia remsis]